MKKFYIQYKLSNESPIQRIVCVIPTLNIESAYKLEDFIYSKIIQYDTLAPINFQIVLIAEI